MRRGLGTWLWLKRPTLLVGGIAAVGTPIACNPGADDGPSETPEYTQVSTDFASRTDGSATTSIRLVDIATSSGIDFVHATGAFGEKWMPETMGSGIAIFDYDGDEWPDLFFVNGTNWEGRGEDLGATSRLFRNRARGDGTYEDVTQTAGLADPIYGMGAAAADFDADGDTDLYVTAVGDNRLYRNDGGRFIDVTAETGSIGNAPGATESAWSTAAAWFDATGDGWLDLLVCNYVDWTPETDIFFTRDGVTKSYATPEEYEGESCRLLENIDGIRFEDITVEAGFENPEGKSLGIAIDDLNGDGTLDVMIANDTYQNFLYSSLGNGRFSDVALDAGVAFDEFGRARAGMGVDVADLLNRGQLSIAIGNFSNEPVSLYTQIQPFLFQDLAGSARLTRSTLLPLTFGLRFADLDLDAYADLLLANGHIEPEISAIHDDVSFEQPPQLFRNDRRGGLVDVSNLVGDDFQHPLVARGLATADLDRDGDLDVVMTANGGPARVFRNDLAPGPGWVRIKLSGAAPNLGAIGATVLVFSGTNRQRFSISTSSSYLSQSETNPVLAGLGGASSADSVIVTWPGGGTTRTGTIESGTSVEVHESGR